MGSMLAVLYPISMPDTVITSFPMTPQMLLWLPQVQASYTGCLYFIHMMRACCRAPGLLFRARIVVAVEPFGEKVPWSILFPDQLALDSLFGLFRFRLFIAKAQIFEIVLGHQISKSGMSTRARL